MSKLSCSLTVFDSVSKEKIFDGSLNELLDLVFPKKVFFKSDLVVKCDCFNFKFKF